MKHFTTILIFILSLFVNNFHTTPIEEHIICKCDTETLKWILFFNNHQKVSEYQEGDSTSSEDDLEQQDNNLSEPELLLSDLLNAASSIIGYKYNWKSLSDEIRRKIKKTPFMVSIKKNILTASIKATFDDNESKTCHIPFFFISGQQKEIELLNTIDIHFQAIQLTNPDSQAEEQKLQNLLFIKIICTLQKYRFRSIYANEKQEEETIKEDYVTAFCTMMINEKDNDKLIYTEYLNILGINDTDELNELIRIYNQLTSSKVNILTLNNFINTLDHLSNSTNRIIKQKAKLIKNQPNINDFEDALLLLNDFEDELLLLNNFEDELLLSNNLCELIYELIKPLENFQDVFFSHFKNINSYNFHQDKKSVRPNTHSERALILYLLSDKDGNIILDLNNEENLKKTRLYSIISELSSKKPNQKITEINTILLQKNPCCNICKCMFTNRIICTEISTNNGNVSYKFVGINNENISKYMSNNKVRYTNNGNVSSSFVEINNNNIQYYTVIDFNAFIANCVNNINKNINEDTNLLTNILDTSDFFNENETCNPSLPRANSKRKNEYNEKNSPESKRVKISKLECTFSSDDQNDTDHSNYDLYKDAEDAEDEELLS